MFSLLAGALFAFVPAQPAAAMPDLTEQTLPPIVNLRSGVVFHLDSRGLLGAAYSRDSTLYYLRYSEDGWHEETVELNAIDRNTHNYTSIVSVYNGTQLMYYDSVRKRVKHAWRSGAGTWSVETVDSSPEVGSYISAVGCGRQKICAAYYDQANHHLKFAEGETGAWSISTVDNSPHDTGSYASLALTTDGRPIIGYYDATQSLPLVAERTPQSDWVIESLPPIGGYGHYISMAQSTDGTTHMSLGSDFDRTTGSESAGQLYYAHKPAGGAWNVETLRASSSAYSSLSLYDGRRPQIASVHEFNSAVTGSALWVEYSYLDGANQWRTDMLFPEGLSTSAYYRTSSFTDGFGDPMVGYEFTHAQNGILLSLHGAMDSDQDMLPDARDGARFNPDGDGDGIKDGVEVLTWGTNPIAADTDEDGAQDAGDRDPLDPNAANIVYDGSCDAASIARWNPLGSPRAYAKTRGKVAKGTHSLFIDSSGVSSGVVQRNLAASSGTGYWLQLFYHRGAGTMKISVGWGSDSDFEEAPLIDNSSEGWQSYERYFTTPAGAGDLRLVLETTGTAWVDAAAIYPGAPDSTPSPQPTPLPTQTATHTPTETPIPPTATSAPTPTMTATATVLSTPIQPPVQTLAPTPSATEPSTVSPTATGIAQAVWKLTAALKKPRLGKAKIIATLTSAQANSAGKTLSLRCNNKSLKTATTSGLGTANFTVRQKYKKQTCYISYGMVRSNTVKVPGLP